MKSFIYLVLTTQCNKHCYHCPCNFSISSKSINKSLIESVNYENYTHINFMGGEPGLLSTKEKDWLLTYFYDIRSKVYIYTNGTNIEYWKNKGYNVVYHITNINKVDFQVELCDYVLVVYDTSDVNSLFNFIKTSPKPIRIKQDSVKPNPNYDILKNMLAQDNISFKPDYIEESYLTRLKNHKLYNRLAECIIKPEKDPFYLSKYNVVKRCKCDWIYAFNYIGEKNVCTKNN